MERVSETFYTPFHTSTMTVETESRLMIKVGCLESI
jgi:hypothetical protein